MKQKVYFVQIGVSYQSPCFLPYSVGCIVAYLKNKPEIMSNYDIPDILVMREKIPDIIKRFDNPSYVAFSCYTWNIEYNKVLAQELKKLFPDVKIIFGGHSVPSDSSFLDEYPFIDYLMHNEGEETTALFLEAQLHGDELSAVPNISYRTADGSVTTEFRHPCDLSGYPSPYLEGVFDNIMKEFPTVEFHATLETNRGCPYGCTYCEWCFTRKVRPFPMERIRKEIEWIAKNQIRYCYCADANFGILERDVEIAEYVVEQKKRYGYPDVFKPCYAKESDDTVFKAGYLLNKNHIDKGVTLAYQSLDPDTLSNIGRKNLTLEHFSSLYSRYTEAGIPTYTELILGLPGETYESFCKGICELLESGQNNSMTVYECQVYPNARIGDPEYQKKFGIKTSKIPLLGIHYNPEFNGVGEYFEIITETASMPKSDWVKACMFNAVLQTFHHLGLLRYFALYLHKEKNISYYDFYNSLYDFIYKESDGYIHSFFKDLYERKADTEKADWTYSRDIFGTTGWYFEEGAFLEMVYHSDVFWQEILPFLKKFDINDNLFEELFVYQKNLVRLPDVEEIEIKSHYNFYKYFEAIDENIDAELKNVSCTLRVKAHKHISSWAEYAREIIWFGKRYSATLLINPREEIEYSEE
ncbi:MAG: cobalamin-dependent protein [Clostridia bacterium]|nr:cobalamin-dependent protein [Clostridia bacterium]